MIINNACRLSVLLLASCAAAPSGPSQDTTAGVRRQHVALYLGERDLDNDWDPVDEQPTLGVEYVNETVGGFGFEIGFMGSEDDDDIGSIDVEARTAELYGGVRKSFGTTQPGLRPYIAGGLSVINAEAEVDLGSVSPDEDDDSLGLYLHAGLLWHFTDSFFAGIDARGLFGTDIDIVGFDTDADYTQFAIVIGLSF